MQFNPLRLRDDAPLLFHTGYRGLFPALAEEVAKLIDVAKLRIAGIGCVSPFTNLTSASALNDWLQIAPQAEGVCSFVGKIVNVDDFAIRPANRPDEGRRAGDRPPSLPLYRLAAPAARLDAPG
jgi:hypothetical protein